MRTSMVMQLHQCFSNPEHSFLLTDEARKKRLMGNLSKPPEFVIDDIRFQDSEDGGLEVIYSYNGESYCEDIPFKVSSEPKPIVEKVVGLAVVDKCQLVAREFFKSNMVFRHEFNTFIESPSNRQRFAERFAEVVGVSVEAIRFEQARHSVKVAIGSNNGRMQSYLILNFRS